MSNDDERLARYMNAWGLAEPQLLAHTRTSQIYTVGYGTQVAILKLLAPTEIDERRGALALGYFRSQGAVEVLRSDAEAQLLEYASGPELVTLVERGDDAEATRIIAEVLGQLHSVPQDRPYDGLVPLERWFQALFDQAATDERAGVDSFYRRGARIAGQLLADQRDIRVLHGDIQHYNIRHSARGWLAFDPKGLVGERTYDCANTLCNPVLPALVHNEARLLRNAGILADALALDRWRVLAFTYAYTCLNASWWLQLGGSDIVDWSLKVAAIIEPHL